MFAKTPATTKAITPVEQANARLGAALDLVRGVETAAPAKKKSEPKYPKDIKKATEAQVIAGTREEYYDLEDLKKINISPKVQDAVIQTYGSYYLFELNGDILDKNAAKAVKDVKRELTEDPVMFSDFAKSALSKPKIVKVLSKVDLEFLKWLSQYTKWLK